jgi:hypothetical protein
MAFPILIKTGPLPTRRHCARVTKAILRYIPASAAVSCDGGSDDGDGVNGSKGLEHCVF